jgi:hypothetical protein
MSPPLHPSTSRPPTRLPLQVSRPEQKTQKLPLLLPHKSEYIPSPQRFGRLARIRLHPPAQKFAPPRRQPMSPRRIPKKPYRSKQVPTPLPSVNRSVRIPGTGLEFSQLQSSRDQRTLGAARYHGSIPDHRKNPRRDFPAKTLSRRDVLARNRDSVRKGRPYRCMSLLDRRHPLFLPSLHSVCVYRARHHLHTSGLQNRRNRLVVPAALLSTVIPASMDSLVTANHHSLSPCMSESSLVIHCAMPASGRSATLSTPESCRPGPPRPAALQPRP